MSLFENVKDFYKQYLIFKFYDQRFHGLLCDSYPNYLITLNEIRNDQLKRSADIRSNKCFPVLSWWNKNNSGSLWRSSQIIDGAGNKRLVDYDKLLSYLYKKNNNLHLYDCRSQVYSIAKGNLENTQITFCDLDDIRVIKHSYDKVTKLCLLNL